MIEITTPLLVDPAYILWTKTRKLIWDDFKGKPDPTIKKLQNFYAHASPTIDYRILWAVDNKAEKIEIQCLGIKVWCFFNTSLAWVRDSLFHKSHDYVDDVLNHEQGHFDLAEEYAQLMENKFKNSLLDKKFPVPGQTRQKKLHNVTVEQDEIGKKFFSQIWNMKNSEDEKYDNETNHGAIKELQDKWDKRFIKLRE